MWQRYRIVYYLLREQGRGITGADEGREEVEPLISFLVCLSRQLHSI